METIENKFGKGKLYSGDELVGKVYAICTACMGIYSEFLTWANSHADQMVKDPADADHIIILSCQVTDMAVLNDIVTLEKYQKDYPGKEFFVGGCLAKRFDIELPIDVLRLDNVDDDGVIIKDFTLIDYAKPFWVEDFTEEEPHPLKDGHLFRDMYPLRIGTGCKGKCTYCTIRHTRGEYKEIPPSVDEFLLKSNVVLIADSPTSKQIKKWCEIATNTRKPISLRNVEPQVACEVINEVMSLSREGLLEYFHSPIQHTDPLALDHMGRNNALVRLVCAMVRDMKKTATHTATNIIIDYMDFPNPDKDILDLFDYVSWNPYWDGVWNRQKAEERFIHYFGKPIR